MNNATVIVLAAVIAIAAVAGANRIGIGRKILGT